MEKFITSKKICHLADYQIEARNSGEGNRYDEFKNGLTDVLESIRLQRPDLIIITGDLYQFADTTSAERKLQTWFLRELSNISPIVITNGNHDLKQKNNQLIIEHNNKTQPDDIDSVLDAMECENITYLKRTGFYNVYGQQFAVWGHYEKFNKVETDQLPYSPWDLPNASEYIEMAKSGELIELYHDPLENCKSFNGSPDSNFTDYGRNIKQFKARLTLMGDIHAPDIIKSLDGSISTYSSSSIMRNYGEGNYYSNLNLEVDGNSQHGYNVVEYGGYDSVVVFTPIKPRVARHTIVLDNFDYVNSINDIGIINHEFNMIRFQVNSDVADFYKYQSDIFKVLKDKYNCIIEEPKFDKGIGIIIDDEHTIDNIESIIDEKKIIELSETYIDKIIDKTSTIAKDEKEDAKKMLIDLFKKEFEKRIDIGNEMKNIDVKKINIDNALTYGDGVEVTFDNNGITKISGSNKVGKTKIFTILGYMFTDKLYSEQKSTHLKNNRLDVFNYTRPNDVVNIEMDFDINGKSYKLIKTLTRAWKRNKSKWQDANWREYINSTPTLDIELRTPDNVITNYDDVMAFMNDLISFDEFYTHLFVNHDSLNRLLKMNTDVMIGEILKIIGLNFFDSLNNSFDDVKDSIMNDLKNPQGTIDSILNEIAIHKTKLVQNLESIELNKNVLIGLDIVKDIITQKVDSLLLSIGSIRTVELVTKDIDVINTTIDVLNKKKSDLDTIINNLKNTIVDTKLINESIKSNRLSITVLNETKTTNENNLKSFDTLESSINTEIENFKTKKVNEKNTKKNDIDKIINSNNNTKSKSNDRVIEIGDVIKDKLKVLVDAKQVKVDKINTELTTLKESKVTLDTKILNTKNSISTIETSINTNNETIKSLNSSKKCPTCGSDKTKDVIDTITENINKLNNTNSELNTTLLSEQGVLRKYNTELTALEGNISDKNTLLSTTKDVDVKYTINDEPTLKIEVQNIIKERTRLNDENTKLEKSKTVIDSDVSYLDDEYIKTRLTKIKNIESDKLKCTNSITESKNSIDVLENEIVNNETILANKVTNDLLIVKKESELSSLVKDIEIENTKLTNLKNELIISNNTIETFDKLSNTRIELTNIDELIMYVTHFNGDLNTLTSTIETSIDVCNDNIEQLKKYNLTTAVIKQYKTLLGKTGLQKYIFGKIVDILNTKLSDLLQDVDFRLFFDKETLELRMLDLKANVISGVQLTSGMESTMLGLSLLNALKTLNQIRKFNFLMIDEVSGQLNNGEDLSYNAENYQYLFVKLLHKIMLNTNIFIVDHVLSTLGENRVLEVQKLNNGSVIKEIKY